MCGEDCGGCEVCMLEPSESVKYYTCSTCGANEMTFGEVDNGEFEPPSCLWCGDPVY